MTTTTGSAHANEPGQSELEVNDIKRANAIAEKSRLTLVVLYTAQESAWHEFLTRAKENYFHAHLKTVVEKTLINRYLIYPTRYCVIFQPYSSP